MHLRRLLVQSFPGTSASAHSFTCVCVCVCALEELEWSVDLNVHIFGKVCWNRRDILK